MFEVRIHGRGGQGVVTAAEMLSIAAFEEGRHAQAFPSFGSERTVAPEVLGWAKFVGKYLEDNGSGTARALSAITGRGTLFSGARQVLIGAAAAVVTYLVGRVIGVAVA